MSQIVYILINEAMPGYIKIGFTTNSVEERLRQLDRTGIPLPFEVYYSAEVVDARKEEEWLHAIFADRRVRDSREFFRMNPELATTALKRVEVSEYKNVEILTDEQEKEVDEIKARRSRFHFQNYGIAVGEGLVFTRNPNIVVFVAENDKVQYNGKTDSLSTTAQELLGYSRRPQGTLYFKYKGEILDDLRRRIDNEDQGSL